MNPNANPITSENAPGSIMGRSPVGPEGHNAAKAPEIDAVTEEVTEWDTPPTANGGRAATVLPDDESATDEELVEEGIEAADDTSRRRTHPERGRDDHR